MDLKRIVVGIGMVMGFYSSQVPTFANASVPEDSSRSGTSANKGQSTFIKGRVLVLDGARSSTEAPCLPRLVRPAIIPPQLSNTPKLRTGKFMPSPEWGKSFDVRQGQATINTSKLTNNELKRLSRYDISVLIDRSGSMNWEVNDVFSRAHTSRWEWCREQTVDLSNQIGSAFPSGITVIPFSNRAERYPNVSASAISEIFQSSYPDGGTMLNDPVGQEFDHYFYEQQSGFAKKPLLMAVITDGAPNDPQMVVDQIIQASRKIHHGDIQIVLFLIGDDPMATAFIDYVRKCRIEAGINFDMISSHKFSEINSLGLAKSLAEAAENIP